MLITKEEYYAALRLIRQYEKQVAAERETLKIEKYKDLTEKDVKINVCKNPRTNENEFYIFITRDGQYVNEEADAIIDGNPFNLECNIRGSRKYYADLDAAYKQVIKKFKKEKKIK